MVKTATGRRTRKGLYVGLLCAIAFVGFPAALIWSPAMTPHSPVAPVPSGAKPPAPEHILGASNSGVPIGTNLVPYNIRGDDIIITQDGTTLENLDIHGDIKVRAQNVTIQNCRLRGGAHIPRSNTAIVDSTDANVANLVIRNSTITPDHPSYFRDGIVGHDYKALENNIYGTNDGLGIFSRPNGPAAANVVAEGNFIHDLTFWSNDPAHADGTHNDGIQVQGGGNIRITGNRVVASVVIGSGSKDNPRGKHGGTAILLQQNFARLANVVVEKNWVDDGQASITIDNGNFHSISVTLRDNTVGNNQFDFGNNSKYAIRVISRSASTITGLGTNIWADTGQPILEGSRPGVRYDNP